MEILSNKSSFQLIPFEQHQFNANLLDQECSRIILAKEALDITGTDQHLLHLPLLLRLILSFYNCLSTKFQKGRPFSNGGFGPCGSMPTSIRISLFKLASTAIQKKLFISQGLQKYYEEVSYSLAFKSNLAHFTISILSENTNLVPVDKIISFYKTLTSEQYLLYLPIHLYFLYGGSLFTIQAKAFKQKIISIIETLSKALSSSDTVVSRNIQFYKGHKQRKFILEESVKMMMLAKSKENLTEMASNLTANIFNDREYLGKQEFLHQIQRRPLDPILTILPLLLRAEFTLFQEKNFLYHLNSRTEATTTNFYANEMTKLFNKCPFNGDERCNCKKCQCVRRNRQSAKLNQQKKRNAVEQVEQMRKRIAELQENERVSQRKMAELQQQNMMLRTLLKEIKRNPSLKPIMLQTIEPLSKVLNNQL